jgi:hypothetical protein
MRDPDLVLRAERAAIALERAWDHWRVMHGLDTSPLPPVTSYVGYSLGEPWGQPRVVFGVAAEEAERLAALLEGHDCVGPVHAEVRGRPDWRQSAPGGAAAVRSTPLRDSLGIPAQRQQPPSDRLPPGNQAETVTVDKTAGESGPVPGQREPDADAPEGTQAAAPVAAAEPAPAANGSEAAVMQEQPEPPLASRSQLSRMLPAVPLLPVPTHDRAGAGRTGTGDPGAGTAASRADGASPAAESREDEEPTGGAEFALPPTSDSYDATPSRGSGSRGRRYQGFPPRYQPGPVPANPSVSRDPAGGHENAPEPATTREHETPREPASTADRENAGQPARTAEHANAGEPENAAAGIERPDAGTSRKQPRRSRPRRAGAHDAGGWPQGEHTATDAAV